MQEQSIKHKQLVTKLDVVEKHILDFFVISEDNTSQHEPLLNTHSDGSPVIRQYTSTIDNIDEVTIRLNEHKYNEWNNYVSNQPAATIHHRAEWQALLKKTYGLESLYFSAHRNNQIVGVLPLTRLKSRLFGDLLVSMPYFQRGGAIADHPLIEQQLMHAANNHADRLGVDHIEYRDDIPRQGLQVQSHKINMVLSLPDSEEILWNSFTPKLRAQIKREGSLFVV